MPINPHPNSNPKLHSLEIDDCDDDDDGVSGINDDGGSDDDVGSNVDGRRDDGGTGGVSKVISTAREVL